ncbi:hypothetical protein ACVWWN_000057 [Mycobacterium sp. URHB0021]
MRPEKSPRRHRGASTAQSVTQSGTLSAECWHGRQRYKSADALRRQTDRSPASSGSQGQSVLRLSPVRSAVHTTEWVHVDASSGDGAICRHNSVCAAQAASRSAGCSSLTNPSRMKSSTSTILSSMRGHGGPGESFSTVAATDRSNGGIRCRAGASNAVWRDTTVIDIPGSRAIPTESGASSTQPRYPRPMRRLWPR